jgi:hypothetical protein
MGRSFSESEDKRAQAEIISSIRQNPIERSNKPMLIGCGSYPSHVFDLLRLARLNGAGDLRYEPSKFFRHPG